MFHVWESAAGVRLCRNCGLGEKKPTTDCCGRKVTVSEKKSIEDDALDYRDDKWRTYMKLTRDNET